MKTIIAAILSALMTLNVTIASITAVPDENRLVFEGKFYTCLPTWDIDGNYRIYYQFRSNDNSYWMCLTEEEIGEIPVTLQDLTDWYDAIANGETILETWDTYILIMDNGGTNECPYNCPKEWECECAVYDDSFVTIIKK